MPTSEELLFHHVMTWGLLGLLFLYVVDTRQTLVKKGRKIMSNVAAALAILARIDKATNALAAEIRDLSAQIKTKSAEGGMTQTEEDEVLGRMSAAADALEAMATQADPETHMEHPDTTSAVTSKVPAPLPFRSTEDRKRDAEAAAASAAATESTAVEESAVTTDETSGGVLVEETPTTEGSSEPEPQQ